MRIVCRKRTQIIGVLSFLRVLCYTYKLMYIYANSKESYEDEENETTSAVPFDRGRVCVRSCRLRKRPA